jgi:hypothetical protein
MPGSEHLAEFEKTGAQCVIGKGGKVGLQGKDLPCLRRDPRSPPMKPMPDTRPSVDDPIETGPDRFGPPTLDLTREMGRSVHT